MKKLLSASLLALAFAVPGFSQTAPKPPPEFFQTVQAQIINGIKNAEMTVSSSDEFKSNAVATVKLRLRKDASGKWVQVIPSAEEEALSDIIRKQYYPLQRKYDLCGFANLYTGNAVIVDLEGEETTRAELLSLANILKALEDGNLYEFVKCYSRSLGHEPDAEELQKLKNMRGTDEEKKIIAQLREDNAGKKDEAVAFGTLAMKTLQIESVKVSGDRAELSEIVIVPSGKTIRTQYQFVKKDGRWLIAREIAKEID